MILEKSRASMGAAGQKVSCTDQNTTLQRSNMAPCLRMQASASGRSAPAAAYNKDVFPASEAALESPTLR